MQVETYRGISFRLKLSETWRERPRFAVHIDTSQTDICFTAVKRDLAAKAASLLAGKQHIVTGEERFDRDVILATDSQYLPTASYFQSQDKRAAVMQLLYFSEFSEIIRTRTRVTGIMEFQDRSDRPDLLRIVDVGIPQLGMLAGIDVKYPKPFGVGESEAAAMVQRLDAFLSRKNSDGASIVGFLGGLAPLAYFYIGGWRWGLASLISFFSLSYLVIWISPPHQEILIGALFPASAWKAYTACELRNRLVSIDGKLSAAEFGSFKNAIFAMSDFLLGACMALIAGTLFLFFSRSILDAFGNWEDFLTATFPYVLLAVPCVWLTELAAGYSLIRLSESAFGDDNRFLSQQKLRWQPHRDGDNKAFMALRPTAQEVVRAAALSMAVPLSIFFLALAQ